MDKDKFLIIKGKAGMGNRILTVLDGILYSKLTNRKLIVDWTDYAYSQDGSNVFYKYFDLPYSYRVQDFSEKISVYPKIWTNNLDKSINEVIDNNETDYKRHSRLGVLSKYVINLNKIDYPEDVLLRSAFSGEIWKMRKHLKSTKYAKCSDQVIYKDLFQENLKLNHEISLEVKNFIDSKFSKDSNTIGVHVRYTDRKTNLDKYPKVLEGILEKHPNSNIFLATDNEQIESNFKEKYGESRILSTSKWYPKDSAYLHQNPNCPDRFQSGKQALIDMYLLSSCNQLVYDGMSTFAVISSLLPNSTSSRVDIDITRRDLLRNLKSLGARLKI